MSQAEENSLELSGSAGTLLIHLEAEKKAYTEFKRLVRVNQWKHAHFLARGVQTHMEFMLLGTGVDSPPSFVTVPRKLQRLILSARLAHFEHSGKNWYHYHLEAELAVTQGGYRMSKRTDCEKEPLPFKEQIPWDKAMLEDAEFNLPFEGLPLWFQRRLKDPS